MYVHPPQNDEVPLLLATGRTSKERGDFINRIERLLSARAGTPVRLLKTEYGRELGDGDRTDVFLTPSGVLIALSPFSISPLPSLAGITRIPEADRPAFTRRALTDAGIDQERPDFVDALCEKVERGRTFGPFLEAFRALHPRVALPHRYASVLVGIPIPSLIAYSEDWETARRYIPGVTEEVVERLKSAFERSIRDDLGSVRDNLAREVIIAHTTSVGGMYDEVKGPDGTVRPRIRLGFSHSARDENLMEKQRSAERLSAEYSSLNIKVFITAAAIGVDDVPIREPVRLHPAVQRQLREIEAGLPAMPTIKSERKRVLQEVRRSGPAFGLPMANVQVYPPLDFSLERPPADRITYYRAAAGRSDANPLSILRPTYALRSGENGLFTVANADALYRVMRVASASELAQVLATVMMLGDDQQRPFFTGGICYYGETDNSRQVFDFISHPTLQHVQLSGLEPMALQDLGSAKHQAELHLLALLILLHRLRTLDLNAIPPYVDGERFDARGFFEEYSQPLTFEEIATWRDVELANDLRALATADRPEDLYALVHSRRTVNETLYREAHIARRRVLEVVLQSVHAVTSLGTPIIYEGDGEVRIRTGFYVAPLEKVLRSASDIDTHFRNTASETENTVQDVRDYHMCVGGVIDLRPHAIVCTSKSDRVPLAGKIIRVKEAHHLRATLAAIEPYSFFSTCGIVATLFRLQALGRTLAEAMMELGTLQEFRWQMPRDVRGHVLMVPGAVEAFRMVSEGLEKNTGTERLDGGWGYERMSPANRAASLLSAQSQEKPGGEA